MTTITIGYTQTQLVDRNSFTPFWDTWRPGIPQHEVTIEVELANTEPSTVAENVFRVTNDPSSCGWSIASTHDLAKIYHAIRATGYRGQGAHWSLSVGDTVTVDGMRLGCARQGWEVISKEESAICRHCGRRIVNDPTDGWVDPEATGDDRIWRETCDEHDTFTAEHEPLEIP